MRTLLDLKVDEKGTIVGIDNKCKLKQRLIDLGIVNGSDVICVLDSANHNPKAYQIKNAVFALRSSLSQYIVIE
ncbi:MAG: ferrous iron transport protein A [Erysipelotrichales bacterium]|nr:ferrous iron transport protein A [Erysipelotrichales bacterium]